VVVAPSRRLAVSFAARGSDVLVLDGVAQLTPARADLALLAVDPHEPWGRTARLPPGGDLRAPVAALRAACDHVVPVGEGAAANVRARGAWLGPTLHTWESLAGLRLGLLSALARPERLVRQLAQRGISVHALVRTHDHGPFAPRLLAWAARLAVDLWLATPKCVLHVPERLGAPVATLDHSVVLPRWLRARLERLV